MDLKNWVLKYNLKIRHVIFMETDLMALITKNIVINAGNSGTFARLLLGLLVKSSYPVKIIGDKSLSRRDFQRVTSPLKQFGARFVSKNESNLPLTISGSEYLRPINYFEKKDLHNVKVL